VWVGLDRYGVQRAWVREGRRQVLKVAAQRVPALEQHGGIVIFQQALRTRRAVGPPSSFLQRSVDHHLG
jgi:hypothetical protein